jgi:predicted ester cyclase
MAEEYETFMPRWFKEVWNQGREDTILNGLNDPDGSPRRGTEGFKSMQRSFLSAFSDLKVTIEETVREGGKIAVRCTVRATHTGKGLGITPKNQPVEFTGMGIAKIEDGKIVEVWNEFDFIKMFQRLGALTLNLQ